MKTRAFNFSLLVVLALIFMAFNASAQTTSEGGAKPAVVKAFAPKKIPAIAVTARAGGKVVVKVTIDSAGKVISTKFVSGNPLLTAVSVEAARRWLFSRAANQEEERSVDLEFVYEHVANREEIGTFFMPPYQAGIIEVAPRLEY